MLLFAALLQILLHSAVTVIANTKESELRISKQNYVFSKSNIALNLIALSEPNSDLSAKVENEFNKILEILSIFTNTKDLPSVIKQDKCQITKEKLSNLREDIIDSLTKKAEVEDVNCELNPDSNADNCQELFLLIQCGVQHLRNGFLKALAEKSSVREVEKWKNAYESLSRDFQKELDDVRRSLSQQLNKEIDLLRETMQNLQRTLTDTLRQLKETNLQLCVSEIGNGKIDNAVTSFEKVNDNDLLPQIIEQAYVNYGFLRNVKNIVEFGFRLSSLKLKSTVFSTVFQQMSRHDHLNNPEVLMLDSKIQQTLDAFGSQPDAEDLKNIKNQLSNNVNNVVDNLSSRIRSNNYNDVVDITKNDCGRFVDNYWDRIVKQAYANNRDNFKVVLEFIQRLNCVSNKARATAALFDTMNFDSPEALVLAHEIKSQIEHLQTNPYLQYGQEEKAYCEDLYQNRKDRLPQAIRQIIWNGNNCVIRNTYTDEYLYAPNDHFCHDKQRRRVFTWRPKGRVGQGFWKLEPGDGPQCFTIKSTAQDEYLYAATDYFAKDKDRRRVFTWREKNQRVIEDCWILEPEDGAKNFAIKSKWSNEYLYAAGNNFAYDKQRRTIFTWRPKELVREGSWEISCD